MFQENYLLGSSNVCFRQLPKHILENELLVRKHFSGGKLLKQTKLNLPQSSHIEGPSNSHQNHSHPEITSHQHLSFCFIIDAKTIDHIIFLCQQD